MPSSPLVELDEVRALLLRLADEDGDAQYRLRHRQDLGRLARRALGEDEAAQVGSRFDRGVDVLLARQPADLDERPREQLLQLRARVVRAHQRRPDEDGVRAGELGCGGLCPGVDGALRDDNAVARGFRHQLELRGAVDPEGAEVARVDADHAGAEPRRPPELLLVVGLDERVETELLRRGHQLRRGRVVEVAQDEESCVGACLPHVAQVLLRREEAFREQRQVDCRTRRAQVVERARERVVDEDGDGPRSSGLVGRHDVLDPGPGVDVAR